MKIILTGADGMLGSDILDLLQAQHIDVRPLIYPEFDFKHPKAVRAALAGEFDILINCAAYTQVDACETHVEEAHLVNARGPALLAKICKEKDALLVHFSTDYVFDGNNPDPYVEEDAPRPLSAYAQSKRAGEDVIQHSGCRYLIIRTAWLYGHNGSNFVKTMLRLGHQRAELKVVHDQTGSPTYTKDLARKSWEVICRGITGIVHITNRGFCSWAEFAEEIFTQMGLGVNVNRCTTEDYPTVAVRPKNSRLENARLKKSGVSLLRQWQEALNAYLVEDSKKT